MGKYALPHGYNIISNYTGENEIWLIQYLHWLFPPRNVLKRKFLSGVCVWISMFAWLINSESKSNQIIAEYTETETRTHIHMFFAMFYCHFIS